MEFGMFEFSTSLADYRGPQLTESQAIEHILYVLDCSPDRLAYYFAKYGHPSYWKNEKPYHSIIRRVAEGFGITLSPHDDFDPYAYDSHHGLKYAESFMRNVLYHFFNQFVS